MLFETEVSQFRMGSVLHCATENITLNVFFLPCKYKKIRVRIFSFAGNYIHMLSYWDYVQFVSIMIWSYFHITLCNLSTQIHISSILRWFWDRYFFCVCVCCIFTTLSVYILELLPSHEASWTDKYSTTLCETRVFYV